MMGEHLEDIYNKGRPEGTWYSEVGSPEDISIHIFMSIVLLKQRLKYC